MGTWVELRCEERSEAVEGYGLDVGQTCLSSVNAGPIGMADDNRDSLLSLMRELEAEARRDGWAKTREGWVCPFCVRQLRKQGKPK